MTRDILLYRLCPIHRIYDCCNSDTNFHCVDCTRVMNEWIDGYDKQIRADAIDEFVEKICEKYTEEESKGNYKQYCGGIKQNIADIAEQLKVKEQK